MYSDSWSLVFIIMFGLLYFINIAIALLFISNRQKILGLVYLLILAGVYIYG